MARATRPRASSRPTASVVICAYTERRWDTLRAAVDSVLEQSETGDELLLVIDHAPELLRAATAAWPLARVLANSGGRGLSGGRNTGVEAARGEVVVFLDDDAVPEGEWLAELLAPYADASVMGVGGVALDTWTTARPRWFPPEFLWVVGCTYTGIARHLHEIRNPIGANMSFRRSVFAVAGQFSEDLGRVGTTPVGCEETEFAIRASRSLKGMVILHQPTSRVMHHVSDDRRALRYFLLRCWSEGQSKAVVGRLVGTGASLSSERNYATDTLPKGCLRGLRDTLRGDYFGLVRAVMILVGLVATGAGYAMGRLRRP